MFDKTTNQFLYFVLLLFLIPFSIAQNVKIQDLTSSFDYSYSDGTLNVTSQNDFMIDTNGNGIYDTLIINITTDPVTSGNYKFIVDISDKNGVISNDTEKYMDSGEKSAIVGFPSELLSSAKFNYSIIIYNSSGDFIFKKINIESRQYPEYETGANIVRITDENINNNLIRIYLEINSSQSKTVNITVALSAGSFFISKIAEYYLTNGLQTVFVDIDNETIKNSHFKGNFTINAVNVGNKLFSVNRNTSFYDFEDFAKTPYIKSITDGVIDSDGDNLSDFLGINFTINSKTQGFYKVTYGLYDESGNPIASIDESQFLDFGIQTLQTKINGTQIYESRFNGPYVLSLIRLKNEDGAQVDMKDSYTTAEYFFSGFVRPPLPDLSVSVSAYFNSSANSTYLSVNLSNTGNAPAFNVQLDIFDNSSNAMNRTMNFLNNGESIIYDFNVSNSSDSDLFTAIADFGNLVDENDESNNIARNSKPLNVSLGVSYLGLANGTGFDSIFQFEILNDGETVITDIQWQLELKRITISSSFAIDSLAPNEKAYVYVGFNSSNEDDYNLKFNATGTGLSKKISSSASSKAAASGVTISSFEEENLDISKAIFEIKAKNQLKENLTDLSWQLLTGDGDIINSMIPSSVEPNETIFIYVKNNYFRSGAYNPIAAVSGGTGKDTKSTTLDVRHVEVSGLALASQPGTKSMFEFTIKNSLNINLTNVSWFFDTKDGNFINSTANTVLKPNETIYVYVSNMYLTTGDFNITAGARSGELNDYRNLEISILT